MKKIITFAVLLLLSVSFALPAFAKEQKFHYLESERDVVISVSWHLQSSERNRIRPSFRKRGYADRREREIDVLRYQERSGGAVVR